MFTLFTRLNVLLYQNNVDAMKQINIKDIAKKAGVSIATVSNVLNNKPNKAKKETIDKIKDIIKLYDYAPNLNARSLVNAKSGMIGVLYYTQKKEVDFSDPFLSDLLTGIEYSSKMNEKFILVHGFSDITDIQSIQKNWKFDGYIVIGAMPHIHDALSELIMAPIVFIDTYFLSEPIQSKYSRCYIYSNDFELSYNSAKYILQAGHRKIAIFTPMLGKDSAGVINERIKGYMQAFEEFDIDASHVEFFDENSLDAIIDNADHYTAVLANSDLLSSQLLSSWRRNDIQGKSIISFDNSFFASLIEPALTTIDLKQKEKGKRAVEELINATSSIEKIKKIYMNGILIERNTVQNIFKG